MILIDPRDGPDKTHTIAKQMLSNIRQIGVLAELSKLPSADFSFEGNGPGGTSIMIGIERKTLHDILHCIDDARYNMQRVDMKNQYRQSFLIVEGMWAPHTANGLLMEGFPNDKGGINWAYLRYRSQPVMYAKLYRYLISVSLSGVVTTFSRDLFHTCFNVCEIFHYFQKKWEAHNSLLSKQMLNIPSFNFRPSLTRRWAAELDGIGTKYSGEAEKLFRTPIRLATADEMQWMSISGIGAGTATKIVKEIGGY